MSSPNIGGIARFDWSTGSLAGLSVHETVKTLGQMQGLFQDQNHFARMDLNTIIYRVQWLTPIPDGTEGGLFWGTTVIEPGKVGDEYFMTHGHFHRKRERTEYYGTVEGEGALILMSEARETRIETMSPGTLHFIPPRTAHRVANRGKIPLRFVACWPSDAGHDYDSIRQLGFSVRLLNAEGGPVLVRSEK